MRLDWIVDRRGDAGPVIHQGDRPTCLACAVSAAHGAVDTTPKSIEFLHWASRHEPDGLGSFSSVEGVLGGVGQPPETQWPYNPAIEDSAATPPSTITGPHFNATLTTGTAVDPNSLTKELEAGAVPIIGLVTTRRFMVLKNAVLSEPDTHLTRHAVLLVGAATYRGPDAGGVVDGDILMCIQNSWGPTWGAGGYGLIAPRAWNDLALVSATLS